MTGSKSLGDTGFLQFLGLFQVIMANPGGNSCALGLENLVGYYGYVETTAILVWRSPMIYRVLRFQRGAAIYFTCPWQTWCHEWKDMINWWKTKM